jgi:hypothetical protein
VNRIILRFWDRYWRAVLITVALIAAAVWTLAISRLLSPNYTFRFPRKIQQHEETPIPIPTLPALGDIAQLLPGPAGQGEG